MIWILVLLDKLRQRLQTEATVFSLPFSDQDFLPCHLTELKVVPVTAVRDQEISRLLLVLLRRTGFPD